jgi:uncharacterized protein YlxP (DUF503 family)
VSDRAYVCLLLIDLHFPDAGSLKAKRAELRPVRERLMRMGLAVAEVDHHDRWQRATLAASLTAGRLDRLQESADAIERWLEARFPQGARIDRAFASASELLEGAGAPAACDWTTR